MLHAAGSVSNWWSFSTTLPYAFGFKPSDAGLPSYVSDYCGSWCYLPLMNVGGYSQNGISGTPNPIYNRFYDYNADVYHDRGPNGNYNPGTLGLSWASFMAGLPTSASLSNNASYLASNQFFAGFLQDTWRVTPKLTLTLSLRAEWENGAKGKYADFISGFDPNRKSTRLNSSHLVISYAV